MEVLFKTPHGSRLYNLHHSDSDHDFYTVVAKKPADTRYNRQTKARYAKQTIIDNEDSMVIDFGTWVEQCKAGVPQACEAMMSQQAEVDKIAAFRQSFVCSSGTWSRYLRTIKSFALAEDQTMKRRRHALRLALNLRDIGRYGRFNPTLTDEDARFVTNYAHKSHNDVLGLAEIIAYEL